MTNGDCVEVASLPDGHIGVRDSKETLVVRCCLSGRRMACISL